MAWDPRILKAFTKTFVTVFLEIVGIPAALVFLFVSFGFRPDEGKINEIWNTFQQYGPAFFAFLVLSVAVYTTHKVIVDDRLSYEKNFYEANSQARLEKAHFVFFHLYQSGRRAKFGPPPELHEWDKELQRELRRYCSDDAISIYLGNTSRYELGSDSRPLPEDKLDYALEFISNLLQTNFEHFFRT